MLIGWGSVATGIAATAHVRVVAVAAAKDGGLVKVKADSLGSARLSVVVSGRTVILNVVWTRANTAMGFGKARKSHSPQF